jgi:hypothetical protein
MTLLKDFTAECAEDAEAKDVLKFPRSEYQN